MNDEEIVVADPTETPAEVVEDDDSPEESPEELKARLAKAEELANNYKIRAEKAEKKAKESEKPKETKPEESKSEGLSFKDSLAIINAKVHEDDIDEVVEYAKFKNISVAEALKSDAMKATLAIKEEYRTTANATNVNTSRRSNAKTTDEALLNNAAQGKLPESEEEIARLIAAHQKKLRE